MRSSRWDLRDGTDDLIGRGRQRDLLSPLAHKEERQCEHTAERWPSTNHRVGSLQDLDLEPLSLQNCEKEMSVVKVTQSTALCYDPS